MPTSLSIQLASCALMCLLGAALAFASRKSSANGSDLNYASIVLISEVAKFTVALSLCVINSGLCFRDLVALLVRRPLLPSALPSVFFAFQNNAAHLAHQSTNPITFQLLMNARSFAVALLQWLLHRRPVSSEQLLPLTTITSCISLYIVQSRGPSSSAGANSSVYGLLMSLVVVLISAASTLANEMLYSVPSHPSSSSAGASHISNMRIYACGSIVNAVVLATSMACGQPALGTWGYWAWAALTLQVLYGLSVAHVIKHMGALFRSAMSCYQVLAAAVITHFAGEEVSWLQLILMMGILIPATIQLARTNAAAGVPARSTERMHPVTTSQTNCSSAGTAAVHSPSKLCKSD